MTRGEVLREELLKSPGGLGGGVWWQISRCLEGWHAEWVAWKRTELSPWRLSSRGWTPSGAMEGTPALGAGWPLGTDSM